MNILINESNFRSPKDQDIFIIFTDFRINTKTRLQLGFRWN